MSKQVHGVVDRISEEKYAVIIVESLQKEFIVDINKVDLSLKEGLSLDISIDDNNQIKHLKVNEQLTKKNRQNVANLMSQLRKNESKFKP